MLIVLTRTQKNMKKDQKFFKIIYSFIVFFQNFNHENYKLTRKYYKFYAYWLLT